MFNPLNRLKGYKTKQNNIWICNCICDESRQLFSKQI